MNATDIEDLQEYAFLCDDKVGEVAQALLNCWHVRSCLSDVYVSALDVELSATLSMFKRDSEIVVNEKFRVVEAYKELIWVGEQ